MHEYPYSVCLCLFLCVRPACPLVDIMTSFFMYFLAQTPPLRAPFALGPVVCWAPRSALELMSGICSEMKAVS